MFTCPNCNGSLKFNIPTQKLNVAYIDRILTEWKNRGLTLQQIEEA